MFFYFNNVGVFCVSLLGIFEQNGIFFFFLKVNIQKVCRESMIMLLKFEKGKKREYCVLLIVENVELVVCVNIMSFCKFLIY